MRGWRLGLLAIVAAAIVWAMRTGRAPEPIYDLRPTEPPSGLLATAFDPENCGTLTCSVRWNGDPPKSEPLVLQRPIAQIQGKREIANPNQPRIGANKGLADCAVWLRKIELTRSRPWDLHAVTVEPTVLKLLIFQGGTPTHVGIVRRGDSIELVAHEAASHSVSARGAAFFTQMLFEPNLPVRRALPDEGIVELSSGTGSFWHRGYLIVSDHPYVGVTNDDGEVKFDSVPAGEYEVVFWKPNWHVAAMERDPELIRHVRLQFQKPAEKAAKVSIMPGKIERAVITFGASDFKSN